MAKKVRVAVLSGGPSAEHAVSLKTGRMILKNLDKNKYLARQIKISRQGKWPITFGDLKKNFDVAFIAMHGEYGEDGQVQKILEKYKIPYTGSGVAASKLGIDKTRQARLFKKAGLAVPRFVILKRESASPFGYPVVVKPVDRGSSFGVSIVKNEKKFLSAVRLAKKYSKKIMAQEYISGKEFTCGALAIHGKLKAFLPTEIIPKGSRFFDYKAKYASGGSDEITPPRLPAEKIKEIQKIALTAHRAIGARGFSRTDMILGENGRFYVLEINTIPGMTEASLLPKAAKVSGVSFKKLLDLIIMDITFRNVMSISQFYGRTKIRQKFPRSRIFNK